MHLPKDQQIKTIHSCSKELYHKPCLLYRWACEVYPKQWDIEGNSMIMCRVIRLLDNNFVFQKSCRLKVMAAVEARENRPEVVRIFHPSTSTCSAPLKRFFLLLLCRCNKKRMQSRVVCVWEGRRKKWEGRIIEGLRLSINDLSTSNAKKYIERERERVHRWIEEC